MHCEGSLESQVRETLGPAVCRFGTLRARLTWSRGLHGAARCNQTGLFLFINSGGAVAMAVRSRLFCVETSTRFNMRVDHYAFVERDEETKASTQKAGFLGEVRVLSRSIMLLLFCQDTVKPVKVCFHV
jgi:hypothetical protein